jgi:TPR repeat protein
LSADQGNADGQWLDGDCLRDGIGISQDLRGAAHSCKLSPDQGNPVGQWQYGLCLRDGVGISQDLRGAAHYFKLSANQNYTNGQYEFGMLLAQWKFAPPRCHHCRSIFQTGCREGPFRITGGCWMDGGERSRNSNGSDQCGASL